MQEPSAVVGEVSVRSVPPLRPGADPSDFPSVPSPLESQPCPGTRALERKKRTDSRLCGASVSEVVLERSSAFPLAVERPDHRARGWLRRQMIFDPTMSKKKKKKKKPFMLDEEGDAQTEETQPSETKEVEPEPTEDKDVEADEEDSRKKDASDDLDDLNFFNQKKKKKKTKKIFDIDEAEEGVKDLKIESDVQEPAEPEDDLDIMLGNKKKKKKNVKFPDEDEILEKDEALEDEDSKKDDGISFSNQTGPAWAGSERDYTYEELLNRVFNIMREKNPDMVAGEKRKFVMKPPQVVRVGTKKTSFVNFTDICKLLHRQPKHLLAFLLAELGTSGSIDGNNQLVIKGRFQQKQIENVLRRYIKEYVTCHTCRSPDTILQKDTRLYFLQCETCHSRCSVASIKTGFQAVTGKRAQLRAKAN
uniref:Eukaryotic translation initiation factor 2 subunit 2 n=3 Tax=Laurasiatheria TaxID=314145 RepID=A0A7J8HH17_MOLMO|nr:eukaryotic translation initiation factor 2 subunit beta [Molossus molossus]